MAVRDFPETPVLVLDLEIFERNVAHMAHTIIALGGKRWRPHVKAIRAPALALRLIAAGASGVTCATVTEAETMVAVGIPEVLIASPVVAPGQLQRLAALNRQARVIVSVDAAEHLALLAAAATAVGTRIPVVVEVDVGLKRSGVPPGDAAVTLARAVRANPALTFCGLMAWEGQTTRIADPTAKQEAIRIAVGLLTDSAHRCRDAALPVEIVSCGGTGTYTVTSTLPGVTELQAGGGVFGDLRYRTEFHMPLEQALVLRATVLSRPAPRRVVCNAGWRYLGVYPTLSRATNLPGVVHTAPAAEHLTLDCDRDVVGLAVGDRIDLAVGYADSTVFLHREILAVRHGVVEQVLQVPASV
ncbi:MAG: alanine racemase [Rhodoferax sp.]|nr:alanine racemase [Rhodoferax sp.]